MPYRSVDFFLVALPVFVSSPSFDLPEPVLGGRPGNRLTLGLVVGNPLFAELDDLLVSRLLSLL